MRLLSNPHVQAVLFFLFAILAGVSGDFHLMGLAFAFGTSAVVALAALLLNYLDGHCTRQRTYSRH